MNRLYNIGIFGRANVGKSSLLNFLTGTEAAMVSDVAGTTADSVRKRMEIPGIGTCNFIDTAGIADGSSLEQLKQRSAGNAMKGVDAAIVVIDTASVTSEASNGVQFSLNPIDITIIENLKAEKTPILLFANQADRYPLSSDAAVSIRMQYGVDVEISSLVNSPGEDNLKESIFSFIGRALKDNLEFEEKPMFHGLSVESGGNLLSVGSTVVLVCPVDSEAPSGRLILPQVMAIRNLLDIKANAVVMQPEQLQDWLAQHPSPSLVVTDSQAFAKVSKIVPANIPLTSFSMLLARSKGPFSEYLKGMNFMESLKGCMGQRHTFEVLMLESCTHHASCEDIGRVKIPAALTNFIKSNCPDIKEVNFTFIPSLDPVPQERHFDLAVQCGGCMVTKRQLFSRLKPLHEAGTPVINYGMSLALCSGIWKRVGAIFK